MQAVDGYIAMQALSEVYLKVILTFLVGFTHVVLSATVIPLFSCLCRFWNPFNHLSSIFQTPHSGYLELCLRQDERNL